MKKNKRTGRVSKVGNSKRTNEYPIKIVIVTLVILGCIMGGTVLVQAKNVNEVYNIDIGAVYENIPRDWYRSNYYKNELPRDQQPVTIDDYEAIQPWNFNPLDDEKYSKIGGFKLLYDELMDYFDGKVAMTDENKERFIFLMHYYFAYVEVDRNNDGKINTFDLVAYPITCGYEKYGIEPSDVFTTSYIGVYSNIAKITDYVIALKENWGCTGEGMRTAVERYYEWWQENN